MQALAERAAGADYDLDIRIRKKAENFRQWFEMLNLDQSPISAAQTVTRGAKYIALP